MGIPSSGEIKMGGAGTNSIAQEKAGTSTGTPSAVQNVSLKGLSVDGVNDFTYTGGAAVDIPGTPDGNSPYGMAEFHGYSHESVNNYTAVTQTQGKAQITRYRGDPDGVATLSDGDTYGYDIISSVGVEEGFRIRFSTKNGSSSNLTAHPTAWVSITVSSSAITDFTINRSAMTQVTVGSSRLYTLDDGNAYLAGSGTGTITFKFS